MLSQYGNFVQSISNRSLARNESKFSIILENQRSMKMKNSQSLLEFKQKFKTIPIDDVTNLACYSDSDSTDSKEILDLDDLIAEHYVNVKDSQKTADPLISIPPIKLKERMLSKLSLDSYVSISECDSLCEESKDGPHYVAKDIDQNEDSDILTDAGLKRHREFHGARKGPRLSSGAIFSDSEKVFQKMPQVPRIKKPKSIHRSRPMEKLYIAKLTNISIVDSNSIPFNIFDYPVCDSVSSISNGDSTDKLSIGNISNENQENSTSQVNIY